MARPRCFVNYTKALPIGNQGQILQARHLWLTVFNVWLYKFESKDAYTEEELSIKTWEGCNKPEDFEADRDKFKRLNNLVMDKIWELDRGPKAKIDRIFRHEGGVGVSKICLSTKRHARVKINTNANIASGCIASAIEQNEKFKVGENVGKMVLASTSEKLKELPHIPDARKDAIIDEFVKEQIFEAGRKMGRAEAAQGLLEILDDKIADKKGVTAKQEEENAKKAGENKQ